MKKILIIALILVSIGGMIGYRLYQNHQSSSAQLGSGAKINATQVRGQVVEAADFENLINLSGSIEANEQVDVRSELSGIAEKILFEEGTSVRRGQVLLKVNDAELQAQLLQATTRVQLTSENERRAKLLIAKEAISKEEYDVAYAEWKSADAQRQLVAAQIQKTSIRAPFSGKIGLRYISPGTYITPATPIAKLVNDEQVKVSFAVPEKYASQVKKGGSITFTLSGNNKTYQAKIYAVETEIEVNNRTLQVRALAPNNQGELIAGSFANVQLVLDVVEQALLVPSQAIIPVQDGKKVFIAQGGKAKAVAVQTGSRSNDKVLVTSGIHVGDTLLTTGVMSLKDGALLNVSLTPKK